MQILMLKQEIHIVSTVLYSATRNVSFLHIPHLLSSLYSQQVWLIYTGLLNTRSYLVSISSRWQHR
jgi:hypothetical protein